MASPPPFSIYEDGVEKAGKERDEGDSSLPSLHACDIPVASVEDESPTSPTSPKDAPHRRTSTSFTATSISSLPSDLRLDDQGDVQARYTPLKSRPPFRNPSSIRAMQMSSPPPFAQGSSPVSHRPRKSVHDFSRPDTPQSHRSSMSTSHLHSPRPGTPRTPVQAARQHHPLVLLHVTLLPFSLPYPAHLIKAVLPPWLVDNFRLLETKLADAVLMGRGVLIPHPKDEYDLLEERLLESLDLATPRILKCGHFYREDLERDLYSDDGGEFDPDMESRPMALPSSDGEDLDRFCHECDRPMAHPEAGVGVGKRRWEVKIYAANGLMRAGAWLAAWTEMERVDVEITPWIPEELKRELERRWDQELRDREINAAIAAESTVQPRNVSKAPTIDNGLPSPPLSNPSPTPPLIDSGIEREGEPRQQAEQPKASVRQPQRTSIHPLQTHSVAGPHTQRQAVEIPLGTLLKNYLFLLSQDRRNIALGILSFLVALLCLRTTPTPSRLPEVYDSGLVTKHSETLMQTHLASLPVPATAETAEEVSTDDASPPAKGEQPILVSTLLITETVLHTASPPAVTETIFHTISPPPPVTETVFHTAASPPSVVEPLVQVILETEQEAEEGDGKALPEMSNHVENREQDPLPEAMQETLEESQVRKEELPEGGHETYRRMDERPTEEPERAQEDDVGV